MLDHFYSLLSDQDYANRIAEGGRQLYLDKFHPLVACREVACRELLKCITPATEEY